MSWGKLLSRQHVSPANLCKWANFRYKHRRVRYVFCCLRRERELLTLWILITVCSRGTFARNGQCITARCPTTLSDGTPQFSGNAGTSSCVRPTRALTLWCADPPDVGISCQRPTKRLCLFPVHWSIGQSNYGSMSSYERVNHSSVRLGCTRGGEVSYREKAYVSHNGLGGHVVRRVLACACLGAGIRVLFTAVCERQYTVLSVWDR